MRRAGRPASVRVGLSMTALALALVCAVPAAADSAQSQYDQAIALLCGTRVPRDPAAAARLLALAAEQGHAGAEGLLGWMAMTGTGMTPDDARAAVWLRLAAEKGNTAAQNNLGLLYATGSGVEHDHAQAERWFRAAAAKGAADAARNLKELLRKSAAGSGGTEATDRPFARLLQASLACPTRPAGKQRS